MPGQVHAFGEMRVDEVRAFGRRFDPQVFHTHAEAAKATEHGGLIASGWHTAALMMRMYSDHYLSHVATLVSPGVEEVRWVLPVRPGDVLSLRVTVIEARRSRSKPGRGTPSLLHRSPPHARAQCKRPGLDERALYRIARMRLRRQPGSNGTGVARPRLSPGGGDRPR